MKQILTFYENSNFFLISAKKWNWILSFCFFCFNYIPRIPNQIPRISNPFPAFPPRFPAYPPLIPTCPSWFPAFPRRFPAFPSHFPHSSHSSHFHPDSTHSHLYSLHSHPHSPHSPHSFPRFPIPAFTDSLKNITVLSLTKSLFWKHLIRKFEHYFERHTLDMTINRGKLVQKLSLEQFFFFWKH